VRHHLTVSTCPWCAGAVRPDDAFCAACGTPVAQTAGLGSDAVVAARASRLEGVVTRARRAWRQVSERPGVYVPLEPRSRVLLGVLGLNFMIWILPVLGVLHLFADGPRSGWHITFNREVGFDHASAVLSVLAALPALPLLVLGVLWYARAEGNTQALAAAMERQPGPRTGPRTRQQAERRVWRFTGRSSILEAAFWLTGVFSWTSIYRPVLGQVSAGDAAIVLAPWYIWLAVSAVLVRRISVGQSRLAADLGDSLPLSAARR
jgi:hypothetical protein